MSACLEDGSALTDDDDGFAGDLDGVDLRLLLLVGFSGDDFVGDSRSAVDGSAWTSEFSCKRVFF